eukprot:6930432-Ditylum_brightwellii.AAC.1
MMCRECLSEGGKSGIKEVDAKLNELIHEEYHHYITSTVVHNDAKPFGKISSLLHHIGQSSSLEAKCTEGHVFCCNGKMKRRARAEKKQA